MSLSPSSTTVAAMAMYTKLREHRWGDRANLEKNRFVEEVVALHRIQHARGLKLPLELSALEVPQVSEHAGVDGVSWIQCVVEVTVG